MIKKSLIIISIFYNITSLITISNLSSSGFLKYNNSRYGKNEIPNFKISNLKKKYFSIFIYDQSTPNKFVHWFIYNIPKTSLKNFLSQINNHKIKFKNLSKNIHQIKNDFNKIGYGGPQPPSGTHLYKIVLYEYSLLNNNLFNKCKGKSTYNNVLCVASYNHWEVCGQSQFKFSKPLNV